MKPFAELVDPFDVAAREWIIDLEPADIHTIVRRRLFLRGLQSGTYQPAGGLPTVPPAVKRAVSLAQLYQLLESEPLEKLRRPRFARGSLLDDLLGEFVEAHRSEGMPLLGALRLLEGATFTMMIDARSRRRLAKKAREITFLEAMLTVGPELKARRHQWKEELLAPKERDCRLLEDDEIIKRELAQLKSTGRALRFALRALVGRGGELRLGPWSCTLRKAEWDHLWRNPRWRSNTPSESAEELLAAKARSSTRAIKEQLARERKERKIAASWAAYGRWLVDHPGVLRDIEFLLGGLSIQLPGSGRGLSVPDDPFSCHQKDSETK